MRSRADNMKKLYELEMARAEAQSTALQLEAASALKEKEMLAVDPQIEFVEALWGYVFYIGTMSDEQLNHYYCKEWEIHTGEGNVTLLAREARGGSSYTHDTLIIKNDFLEYTWAKGMKNNKVFEPVAITAILPNNGGSIAVQENRGSWDEYLTGLTPHIIKKMKKTGWDGTTYKNRPEAMRAAADEYIKTKINTTRERGRPDTTLRAVAEPAELELATATAASTQGLLA